MVKTRFEVIGFCEYNNTLDAFRKILAKEGVKGLFTGLGISLIRDVPFSGVFYPVYKGCRKVCTALLINPENNQNHTYNMALVTSLSGFMANGVSCIITQPIDLIRTRIYFQFYNQNKSENYTGILHAITKIYRNEGFFGFFRGLFPRIARKGMGKIVAWVIYEYLVDKNDAFISS